MPSFDFHVGKTWKRKKINTGPGPGSNQTTGATEGYPGPTGQRERNSEEVERTASESGTCGGHSHPSPWCWRRPWGSAHQAAL